jgi:hypothetical protein
MRIDGIAVGRRLGIRHVKRCARQLPRIQRAQQCGLIDDPAARDVDQMQRSLRACQHIGIDQMGRLRCCGKRQDQMIDTLDECLDAGHRLNARLPTMPGGPAQHLDRHAEGRGAFGNRTPDRAETGNADHFAGERTE